MFRPLRLRFKPPSGWHAVGWELLIVTLGVLIALGAQQMVEAVRDRQVAVQTRGAVIEEIEQNLLSLSLRRIAEPCISRRLGELHAMVNQWGQSGTFVTPLWVAQAPSLDVVFPRYEAAVNAGNVALLGREEQYRWGTIVASLGSSSKFRTRRHWNGRSCGWCRMAPGRYPRPTAPPCVMRCNGPPTSTIMRGF